MKLRYIIVCLIAIGLLFVVTGFLPHKYAVHQADIVGSTDYILVKMQKATISQWIAIGDHTGTYDKPLDIRLTGSVPAGFDYAIECGDNTFVCYGSDGESENFHGQPYETYNATNWDILYPINRNSLFNTIYSKSYLCINDMR